MWVGCGCTQVEARQKLLENKEKEEDGEKKESINEDAPGNYYCLADVFLYMTTVFPQSWHVIRRRCFCSSLLGCHEYIRTR